MKQKGLDGIAREFAGRVGVDADPFPIEPASFVNTGQSWFSHVEPLARAHDAFIYDDENGRAQIATKPRGRHSGALSIGDGGNIVSASAKITEQGRHDEVIVRGQSSRGADAAALRPEGRATDASVKRRRPRIIVLEGDVTAEKLKKRAEREVKRGAGFSREATITVAGWRDEAGMIFQPHFEIPVDDARIYINQDMAIKTVKLTQTITANGSGTQATLTLVDPRALGGEASGKKSANSDGEESAEAWTTPEPSGRIGVDF